MATKLSFNPGPCVGNRNYEFEILISHQIQLTQHILNWSNSLPKEITDHIEIITVNPDKSGLDQKRVSIKIILSGGSDDVDGRWKYEVEENFLYPSHQDNVLRFGDTVFNDLKKKIFWGLERKTKTYQTVIEHLTKLKLLLSSTS